MLKVSFLLFAMLSLMSCGGTQKIEKPVVVPYSYEHVSLMFDQHKGAMYALYNKTLHASPNFSATIVYYLEISTIDGTVKKCGFDKKQSKIEDEYYKSHPEIVTKFVHANCRMIKTFNMFSKEMLANYSFRENPPRGAVSQQNLELVKKYEKLYPPTVKVIKRRPVLSFTYIVDYVSPR